MAEKNYFHPWEGKDYTKGINGNTILIVGVQHWCDPSYWGCSEESPFECLQKRDETCTVWNREEYEKNDIKRAWWIKDKENKMPQCPLYESCKSEDKDKCLLGKFRFLHCETKISVYDHIKGEERTKRTDIFALVFESLVKIFRGALRKECNITNHNDVSIINLTPEKLNEDEKKGYWDRIVFTNYIQHYTKLLSGNRLDPEELKYTPETNKNGIERCLKKFKDNKPDVIIILKEEEIYKRVFLQVKEKGYVPLEQFTVPGKFYVLAKKSSNLYQSSPNMEDFIKYCINKWRDNIKTLYIVKLEYYLEDKKWGKTIRDRYESIVKLCPPEIQKEYYKEKKFCYNKLSHAKSYYKNEKEEFINYMKNLYDKFINEMEI